MIKTMIIENRHALFFNLFRTEMRVPLCGGDIFMSRKFLHGIDVHTCLNEFGAEIVAKIMETILWISRLNTRPFKSPINTPFGVRFAFPVGKTRKNGGAFLCFFPLP